MDPKNFQTPLISDLIFVQPLRINMINMNNLEQIAASAISKNSTIYFMGLKFFFFTVQKLKENFAKNEQDVCKRSRKFQQKIHPNLRTFRTNFIIYVINCYRTKEAVLFYIS